MHWYSIRPGLSGVNSKRPRAGISPERGVERPMARTVWPTVSSFVHTTICPPLSRMTGRANARPPMAMSILPRPRPPAEGVVDLPERRLVGAGRALVRLGVLRLGGDLARRLGAVLATTR